MKLRSLALFICAACSTSSSSNGFPPPMRVADYDTSCTSASDCAPVSEGGVCACQGGGCANAAVNKKDQARYEADYAARQKLCTAEQDSCVSGACDIVQATCIAGRCGVCSTSLGCGGADAGTDASNDAAHE